jgi:hypothetical protein
MNSGSDSDSFDEGDLTARGRKAKEKSGVRANEKGKQKAKDVRTPTRDNAAMAPAIFFELTLRWSNYTAGICMGSYVYSFLG